MIVLRPYQEDARDFLTDVERGFLADRRGLGKTFPALAAAGEHVGTKFLYITPSYLQPHAASLIETYFGEDMPIHIVQRGDKPTDDGWSVVGYHTFTTPGIRRTPWLLQQMWDWVIFDEAHRLRNRDTQWRKYFEHLCGNAHGISMLSGTPIVTSPANLWSPLDLMYPGRFGTYWQFAEFWCNISHSLYSKEAKNLRPEMREKWNEFLGQYLLRRTKLSLPEPVEHDIFVPMNATQRTAYRRAKRDWIGEHDAPLTGAGAMLIELRRITSWLRFDPLASPKIQATLGLLEDEIDGPVIIWCWHRDAATVVAQVLTERTKRRVQLITGDTPSQKRFGMIDEWNTWPKGILVATIGSIQEGLDLFHAADEIFYEASYVHTHLDQCIGRVHREGQKASVVNIYYIACDRTVDTKILRAARRREIMSDEALVSAEMEDDE
jgi:SWI/SNF-related matrix-associated actin-dependent regulator 1 of chromatin subfamily A